MKHRKIGTVMTREVMRATPGMPLKEVAELLAVNRISGLPVVDGDERVLGVMSASDLVRHQARCTGKRGRHRTGWTRLIRSWRGAERMVRAATAEQLMSQPAITATPEQDVAEAARLMERHRIERLPVVDADGRLLGIATRRDLLRVFQRPDQEIREEVVDEVLVGSLWLAPHTIEVAVDEGVVTLEGCLERRSELPIAVRMVEAVDGVVGVVDHLTYRKDDSHAEPAAPMMPGTTDGWLNGW